MVKNEEPPLGLLFWNRVPKDYFITKWCGESNITVHAWSYHLALQEAWIERANIITYSSILPWIAKEIKQSKYNITHWEVMETIMSACSWNKWEKATAWITFGMLYDKKTKEKFGWLVCEHQWNYSIKQIKELLKASLSELYTNWFDKKYYLKEIKVITNTIDIKKEYWTALVALCFVNYYYPIVSNTNQ
jgi:arginine decarboxylase